MNTNIKTAPVWQSILFGITLGIILALFSYHVTFAESALIGKQLSIGSNGADVTTLQTFLATNNMIYPEGLVTGHYGPLTAKAVVQFQLAYGLPTVGNVGPLTLAKINSVISSGYGLDISAPGISGLSVTTTSTNASASWLTNEGARGKIFYSATPMAATEAGQNFMEPTVNGSLVTDTTLGTSKTLTIPSLEPHTLYYYRAESIDQSGNVTITPELTFTTGS